jgi:chromosomal replication initiator protein
MDFNIWEQILGRIEAMVNQHSYSTWFRPTAFIRDSGHTIAVRVPKPMFVEWLTRHYSVVLSEALTSVGREGTSVVFVPQNGGDEERNEEPTETASTAVGVEEAHVGEVASVGGLNPRYTFDTFIVGPRTSLRMLPAGRSPKHRHVLQPAVHLRRCGSRQNPPDARGWSVRPRT